MRKAGRRRWARRVVRPPVVAPERELHLMAGSDAGGISLGTNLAKVVLDQRRDSLDPEQPLTRALTGGRGDTVTMAPASAIRSRH